jgi:ribonuclease J
VILIENGDVLEFDQNGARVAAHNQLDNAFIDEESLAEIQYDIIRERKKLAYGGAITLVVKIDKKPGIIRRTAHRVSRRR